MDVMSGWGFGTGFPNILPSHSTGNGSRMKMSLLIFEVLSDMQ